MNKFTLIKRCALVTLLILIFSLAKGQSCANCTGAIMNATSINNASGVKNYCYDANTTINGINVTGGSINVYIKTGVTVVINSFIIFSTSNNTISVCSGGKLDMKGSISLGNGNILNMETNTRLITSAAITAGVGTKIYVTGNTAIENCGTTMFNDNSTIVFTGALTNPGKFFYVSRGDMLYTNGDATFTQSPYGSRMNWIGFDEQGGKPTAGTAMADICPLGSCTGTPGTPYKSPLWPAITRTGNGSPCGQVFTAPLPVAAISVVKKVSSNPALQPDGSYNIGYSLTVKNESTATTADDLKSVQITDDLTSTFPAPATFTVNTALTTVTGTIAKNLSFNGSSDQKLLTTAATNTLAFGASATVNFTVNVKLNGTKGTFKNDATTTGTGVTSNDNVTSTSSASVTLPGIIGVAKSAPAGPIYPNGGGTYDITYVFNMQNLGSTDLTNVQLVDDLTATFPAPATFTVTSLAATGTVTKNPAYNGTTDKNLLTTSAANTLAVGASSTITLVINVDTKGQVGTFKNSATATGKDPYNNTASDISNTGTVPNPTDDTKTDVILTQKGVIGLAKSTTTPVLYPNGLGTYDVTYVFNVKNAGAVPLSAVQITDNLVATFPAPATFTVTSLTQTGGAATITLNNIGGTAYNGKGNNNLLTVPSTLAVGASATITLKINVDLKGTVGVFHNNATATAVDPNANNTTDISNDGTFPNGTDTPTDVDLTQKGVIGLTKTTPVGLLYPNGTGTYDITYVLTLKNNGLVKLDSVQVTDKLTTTFPAPAVVTVTSVTPSAGLNKNPAYNGNTNINLLTGGDGLAVGATATITIKINVDLKGKVGTYKNTATTTAKDKYKNITTATSNVDINLTQKGTINITKTGPAGAVYPNAGSTYDLTYVFVVKNSGAVPLDSVQVVDNLALTFPAPATFTITSLTQTAGPATITLNTAGAGKYNGNGNNKLLVVPGSKLAVGASVTITLKINVDLKGQVGTFKNLATATGKDPNFNTATDISNSGNSTDVLLTRKGAITLLKTVGANIILPKGNGTYDVTYTLKIINEDVVPLSKLKLFDTLSKTFPAPTVVTVQKPIGILVKGTGIVKADSNYNGVSPSKFGILDSSSTLAVGDTAIITLLVNVDLKGAVGTFYNSATTKAVDPTNNQVTGTSNAGIKTGVILTKKGIIDLQKSTSTPILYEKPDGSYDVKYSFKIINKEKVPLKNLRLFDTLLNTFPAPAVIAAKAPLKIKGGAGIKINPAYNGLTDFELLDSTSTLAINDTAIITLDVNVDLNGTIGVFKNFTTATGIDLSNTLVKDTSMAKVHLTQKGLIGVSKSISPGALLPNANGTYDLTYTFKIKNLGKVKLAPVSLYDTLSKAFPAPAVFTVKPPVVVKGTVKPNAQYNGKTKLNLLDSLNSSLAVNDSAIITLAVNVDLKDAVGKFYNIAKAIGRDSLKNITIDVSNDGINVDTNKHDTTIIILTKKGVIGVSKSITPGALLPNANGTYDLTYTFKIKNLGKVKLAPVSLYDTLSKAFPAPAVFTVKPPVVVKGTVKPNAQYNGKTKLNLLDSLNSSLAVNDSAIITLAVNVDLKDAVGKFYNIAKAIGRDSLKNITIDVSNDGINVDTNKHDTTIIILTKKGVIGVSKSITPGALLPNANGTYDLTYTFKIKNLGKVKLTPVSLFDDLSKAFPSPALFTVKPPVVVKGTVKPNLLFNGVTQPYLLDSLNSSLAVNDSAIITLAVNVDLKGEVGKFYNLAKAIGRDSLKNVTIDTSNDGINVDTTKHNDTTIIILTRKGVIGVSKSISPGALLPNANGTYDLIYTFKIKNLGKVKLTPVSLFDDLSKAFPSPALFTVKPPVVVKGTVKPNLLFNGVTQPYLLDSLNSSLAVNDSAIVTLAVNVDLKGEVGKFYNLAKAIGRDSLKNVTIDTSNDGINVDTTHHDTTVIVLTRKGLIGVSKVVSAKKLLPNANGTYDLTYTFKVKNLGKVKLEPVSLFDNLVEAFPAPAVFTVKPPVVLKGTVKANVLYNGVNQLNLLDSLNSKLAVNDSAIITLAVNVDLKGEIGKFYNLAKATGRDSLKNITIDISNDGINVDTTKHDTTIIILTRKGIIGVSKAGPVGVIKPNAKGTFDIAYSFTVKNLGKVDLSTVQVRDNLAKTFPAPAVVTVQPLTISGVTTLKANPGYNGNSDIRMLDSTASSLAVGTTATITMLINVDLKGSADGVFKNSAIATGTDINGNNVWDVSNNGVDPNNDPKDTTTTDVVLTKNPLIGIAKSASAPILTDGKQTYEITYTFQVKNYGSVNLNTIQVTDNLKQTFPDPLSFQKITLTATGGLTVNSNYNGITDVNLLDAATSNLPKGSGMATITLVIQAKLGYKSTTYYNTAIATGVGENNTGNTTDISCDGQTPDPNGNGTPNDTGEDNPTPVVILITDIFIPDGVSPNGDSKNDKFDIKGIENYPNNTLLIFNRWGAQVYSTKAYNNTWDGTSDSRLNVGGNLLPDGVYYYVLDLGNGSKAYTGYIYLKR